MKQTNQASTTFYAKGLRKRLAKALAMALYLLSFATIAQDTNIGRQAPSPAPKAALEELLVYGTKRSGAQIAQDVPAQVSAYGAQQLQTRQVVTLEDLSFATPNVQLDDIGTSPGVANFTIRGLGINSSIPSIEPNVGVFVDGIYMGVSYGVVTDTFDLESVEIYKGPQGVLFGRNVTGGAVLLRSKRPTGEFGVRSKVGIETGLQSSINLSIENALTENLAGKLSLYRKDDQGWFDNDTLNQKVGEEKSTNARGTLLYRPSDKTELTLIYELGSQQGDGAVPQNSFNASASQPSDTFDINANQRGDTDIEWQQITFESHFAIGDGTLTNLMGYRDLDNFTLMDIDGGPLTRFDAILDLEQDQFSNETRYNNLINNWWDFTTGIYYFEQDMIFRGGRMLGTSTALNGGNQKQRTWALFFNNDVILSDTWTITLGGRYSEEEKTASVWAYGECDYDTWTCPTKEQSNSDNNSFDPKLGFVWSANEDVKLYGHWTRAFRSGMYNFRTAIPNDPRVTDVEEHDAFELGIKSTFADNTVQFNAALFHTQISDVVRETNYSDPLLGIIQDVINAADATVQGLDADVVFLLSENLSLNLGVGLINAEYDKVIADLNRDGQIDSQDKNLDFPRLPEKSFNIGVNYDFNLRNLGYLALHFDYNYRDDVAFTDNNVGRMSSYAISNASINWHPDNDHWSVSLYGKNLNNEAVLGGVTALPSAWTEVNYFAPVQKGRRWGLEIQYDW